MTTKVQIVNDAYSQLRISGLTVQPGAEDTELALHRLDTMMAELSARNICTNYNQELGYGTPPDANSLTNVPVSYWHMMATNLAIRLVPDFNKAIPPNLQAQASQALSLASAQSAADNIREVDYPRRMPRGSGNTLRFNRWQRYQRPNELPPNDCATNQVTIGDINDYTESFVSYLNDAETIASFTIEVDDGLTIQSSSNDDPLISYRIKVDDNSSNGVWQQVKIIVTTSDGRIETRLINFDVTGTSNA